MPTDLVARTVVDDQRRRSIVWVSLGIASYVHRIAPVARAAEQRGHRFRLITADAAGAALARSQGVDVIELLDQGARWEATFPGPHWPRGGALLGRAPGIGLGPRLEARRTAEARRAVMSDAAELLAAVQSCDPDVVVTEAEQHRDIRVMLGAGLPVVVVDDLYGTVPGPGAPPAGSSVRGGRGPRAVVASALAWRMVHARFAIDARAERWWLDGADRASVLDDLAERAGLGRADIVDGGYLYHRYPNVMVARPIAATLLLPGDDRSGVLCGPVVDTERSEALESGDDADRWSAVRSRRAEGTTGHLVYASIGTVIEGQERFVRAVVDAFAHRPGTEVALAVGRDALRWADAALPPNVHAFARLPQLDVLGVADAMVGQAGVASVHEAMWFGVPQVLVPAGGIGQAGLAMRVEAAGLGLAMAPRRASAERLAAAVDAVSVDASMRRRLDAVSLDLRSHDSAAAIVDLLGSHHAAVGETDGFVCGTGDLGVVTDDQDGHVVAHRGDVGE